MAVESGRTRRTKMKIVLLVIGAFYAGIGAGWSFRDQAPDSAVCAFG